MKILIIRMWSDELNIHSYNCQEIGLAKALIRKNNVCDIVLYTTGEEKIEKLYFDDNSRYITIYYLKAKTFLKNTFYDKKIYDICKKYDCIQCTEYDQVGNLLLNRRFKNMCIYHGPYASRFTKRYKIKVIFSDLLYSLFPKYKNNLFISKSDLASDFLKAKGVKNVYTLGVGIDLERFDKNVDIGHSKQLNDFIATNMKDSNQNTKYMLYIGRLEKRRNIEFIIKRLYDISKENDNIKLIIVGTGSEKYTKKVFRLADELNVKNKIVYFSKLNQSELVDLYKISSVFLLPTRYEIFGMVILEAMYFGVPVITTLNGGSSTLIDHGKNGFICDLCDVDSWNENIQKLVTDGNFFGKISANANATICTKFTWNILSEKFVQIYKQVSRKEKVIQND